jgi:fatty-acyl-CoA synthase
MPDIEAKIVHPETGEAQPPGAAGEIYTRGYALMRGYWDDPAATEAAIDAEGWMHTGDIGTLDGQGYLNIVGRIKDMVIRGGENVYPREVEEILYQHPAIAGAQVIGVPDARFGEELMAWIVLRDAAEITADDVRAFCRARLSHYKVPRYVKFTASYPQTVTGKVQKFRLREMAIEELRLEAVAAIATA